MTQITPVDASEENNSQRDFHPMPGLSNPHLQTMLPRLIRRRLHFTPFWQRLELPDDDFVDLAWSEDPQLALHKPRLWCFMALRAACTAPTPTA